MKEFFIGTIFISLFLPIINSIVSIIEQGTEHICTKIAVKTVLAKKAIEPQQPQEEINTNVIGFHVSREEEYYDDDEGE
jgi:hypothetical protein